MANHHDKGSQKPLITNVSEDIKKWFVEQAAKAGMSLADYLWVNCVSPFYQENKDK